jgi:hypothetical protein
MATVIKKAIIRRFGIPGIDEPEIVECVVRMTKEQIKSRLIELQKGYCEVGDSKPKITTIGQGDYVIVKCESSDTDWSFATRVTKSFWTANKTNIPVS